MQVWGLGKSWRPRDSLLGTMTRQTPWEVPWSECQQWGVTAWCDETNKKRGVGQPTPPNLTPGQSQSHRHGREHMRAPMSTIAIMGAKCCKCRSRREPMSTQEEQPVVAVPTPIPEPVLVAIPVLIPAPTPDPHVTRRILDRTPIATVEVWECGSDSAQVVHKIFEDPWALLCEKMPFEAIPPHPNLVTYLGVQGMHLLTGFVDNVPLCVVARGDKVWVYLAGVMAGVEHMHRHGFVHRDLKPDNVLANKDVTEVRVCDLGHAIHQDKPSRTSGGTRCRWAPEQVMQKGPLGQVTHPATDIWAFGVLVLELAFRVPWMPAAAQDDLVWDPIERAIVQVRKSSAEPMHAILTQPNPIRLLPTRLALVPRSIPVYRKWPQACRSWRTLVERSVNTWSWSCSCCKQPCGQ